MGSVSGRNPAGGLVSLTALSSSCTTNSRKCSPSSCGRSSTGLDCSSSSSSSTSDRLLPRLGVLQSRSFFSGSLWFPSASQCSSSGRLPTVFHCVNGVGVLPTGNGNTLVRNGTSLVDLSKPQRRKESLVTLVEPVADDLRILNDNLHNIVGAENPLLMAAAEQIFGAGGKRLRPALVFLVSKATSQLAGLEAMRPEHWRLAQVIEMIHTASLIHDDVLDESDTRRGQATIHNVFGTRVAVLAGDFMFAQSSWYLANLDNLEVIKLISQVIKDFASGEIKQAMSLFDCDITLQDYLDKSYYKTASLIAASTRSAAIFSGMSTSVCDQMYDYGLHLGMAFQVVDDILDFTQSSEQLGKPAGSDLAKGNLTAPVLFALQSEPELRQLISTEFNDEGSLDAAIALVSTGGGIEKARQLAQERGNLAMKNLDCLPQSPLRHSLEGIVDYVLDRIY